MATKTKTKIKEPKNSKPGKINDEELSKLQATVNSLNKAQLEIGTLETQKHSLLHTIAGFHDSLGFMQKEFEKKYGTPNIDILNGTINYENNVETN
jgi:hypothetical protein